MTGLALTLVFIFLILLIISFLYRPYGTGYYSYAPSGLFLLIVVLLLLWALGVL